MLPGFETGTGLAKPMDSAPHDVDPALRVVGPNLLGVRTMKIMSMFTLAIEAIGTTFENTHPGPSSGAAEGGDDTCVSMFAPVPRHDTDEGLAAVRMASRWLGSQRGRRGGVL